MSIRSIIFAASIPLFILLAAVNGALLYFQSRAEMIRGLDQRALAAAVTGAEFLSQMERPQSIFEDPVRARSIAKSVRRLPALDGYYLVDRDGKMIALAAPVQPWDPGIVAAPTAPIVSASAQEPDGQRYVVALAPVASDGFVAARFDAGSLFARIDDLRRWILLGVGLAALIGLAAGWYVARRIVRELAVSRATMVALDAGETLPDTDKLSISEASDLAAALRLVDANRRASQEQSHRQLTQEDRDRTDTAAFGTWRQSIFAPVSAILAGANISVRIMGDASPGCFYAICKGGEDAALVVGECEDSGAVDALASAIAARRFLERQWRILGGEQALELARLAFTITRLDYLCWTDAATLDAASPLLSITDAETTHRARIYAEIDPDIAPDKLLDDIAALLQPAGIFGALRRI